MARASSLARPYADGLGSCTTKNYEKLKNLIILKMDTGYSRSGVGQIRLERGNSDCRQDPDDWNHNHQFYQGKAGELPVWDWPWSH